MLLKTLAHKLASPEDKVHEVARRDRRLLLAWLLLPLFFSLFVWTSGIKSVILDLISPF